MVCADALVDSKRLRDGFLSKEELRRISVAVTRLQGAPLHIDDMASLRLHELRARARRRKCEKGIELIIVDYLQLMTPPRAENRTQGLLCFRGG